MALCVPSHRSALPQLSKHPLKRCETRRDFALYLPKLLVAKENDCVHEPEAKNISSKERLLIIPIIRHGQRTANFNLFHIVDEAANIIQINASISFRLQIIIFN